MSFLNQKRGGQQKFTHEKTQKKARRKPEAPWRRQSLKVPGGRKGDGPLGEREKVHTKPHPAVSPPKKKSLGDTQNGTKPEPG